jgi:hypothetical protein
VFSSIFFASSGLGTFSKGSFYYKNNVSEFLNILVKMENPTPIFRRKLPCLKQGCVGFYEYLL